ncbi:MAG: DUF2254 domain-containing protein [Verrucomicrobia bacterium]|nr:DUF2254 domain-containing protein [Verrucomicrobiota bacterium]
MAEPSGRSQFEPQGVGTVRGNAQLFMRATLLVAAALVVAFLMQVLVDALSPERSLGEVLRRPWTTSPEELHGALGNISRTFNQLLAVVITALAIAVPLTASMYTPKLLEIFLGDRLNRIVLGLILFSTVNTLWVSARVSAGHVPRFGLVLTFVLLLACFAVLLPYFFYVFRFLHPSHILERLQQSAVSLVQRLPELKNRRSLGALQTDLRERIEHITSLGMRSLDREDRDVAQGALRSIQRVAISYPGVKGALPEAWFQPTFRDAMRMSNEAMEALEASRTWVEMECLRQVELVFLASLAKAPDLVGTACQVLRVVGLRGAHENDLPVLGLATDLFHSFVRAAVNRRDVRSAYHVLYQYRLLAEELLKRTPGVVGDMGKRLAYYADAAVQTGLNFVAETIAYDLGVVTHQAREQGSEAFQALLAAFTALPRQTATKRPVRGVLKASVILAARLELAGETDSARPLLEPVRTLDEDVRREVFADLLDNPPERFWEVTDRLINFDYTPPDVREAILSIKNRL